ncbi:PH domain-containing protein [Arthrobacter sp. CG_A4]|uniref:PH domain-containing protein n=1 Tax=Arthrobacter sp. CG_A4 TaxID=3071706 RepID=UPI002E038E91|nr:putative membrane protein [Arthrobacter sp. CG_A4]
MITDTPQRLPVKAMAAMSLRGAPSVVSLLFGGFLYWDRPGLWPGPVAIYVIGGLVILRLVHPVYAWATLRYEISKEDFSLTRGLLFRTTSTTAWRDVSVVDIDSPWAFRRFGLGVLSLRSGGQDDAKIDVPGVDHADLETIVGLARAHGAPGAQPGPSGSTARGVHGTVPGSSDTTGRTVVYTARKRDLVAANLIYGHVVLLGTGAVLAVVDAADQLASLDGAVNVFSSHPWAGSLVLCGAVLLGGSVAAVVKYHNFTVSSDPAGLSIRYGWLSTNQRDVRSSAVGGITARRNLIEMLLDRVRVALLTTDSDAQMGTNMVLPSLPRRQVRRILDTSLPKLPRPALLESSGRGSIARSIALFAAIGAPALGFGWVLHRVTHGAFLLAAVATVALWCVLALAVRLATARFSVVGTRVGWASHSFVDREVVLAATGLHSVSIVGARTTTVSLVRAHYFAGRPRTLAALSFSPAVPDQMGRLVEDTSPKIAALRRRPTVKQPTAEEFVYP